MRRALILVLVAAVAAAFLVTQTAAKPASEDSRRYTVEFDNAFGLVAGADLKVAGVRAGHITGMRVDRRTKRALVDFEITERGFGSLRRDVFCESRPQSLIGEYFIDCRPGDAREELRPGSTIPVARTASTIPADLVNNVMRRPYRERLRLIIEELGAGVAGRAGDLNETIRRASPALRETDRVLRVLARQNVVLQNLAHDADTVLADLSANRKDVGRWVAETQDAAAVSAKRRAELAAGFRKLPGFLRELRPTMAELGNVADAQGPALTDLEATAGELERLFDNLEPFADSTRMNLKSLAETTQTGRAAVRAARPTTAELRRLAADLPEVSNNADIVLGHLHDRRAAVEPDPRSPGGKGYTGLEALLSYVFDQTLAINVFDQNGYILKINLHHSKCSDYQNAASLRETLAKDPGFLRDCMAELGPNQPGITTPDPTFTGAHKAGSHGPPAPGGGHGLPDVPKVPDVPGAPAVPELPRTGAGLPDLPKDLPKVPGVEVDLRKVLGELLGGKSPGELPQVPDLLNDPNLPEVPALTAPGQSDGDSAQALLDYLLG